MIMIIIIIININININIIIIMDIIIIIIIIIIMKCFQFIYKWWAQYCELKSDYEEAIKYYQKADELSLAVKVLCSSGKLNEVSFMNLNIYYNFLCNHIYIYVYFFSMD